MFGRVQELSLSAVFVCLDLGDGAVGIHWNVTFVEDALHNGAHFAIVIRKNVGTPRDDDHVNVGESMAQRQGEFEASGSTTNYRESRVGLCEEEPLEKVTKTGNGLDGNDGRMEGCLRRLTANVDRAGVKANRRTTIKAVHFSSYAVEARRSCMHEASSRKATELIEIEVNLLLRVMPRDVARQHARVGRENVLGNERDAEAVRFLHAQHLQDVYVCVASSDQDQVRDGGDCVLLLHDRYV